MVNLYVVVIKPPPAIARAALHIDAVRLFCLFVCRQTAYIKRDFLKKNKAI